jgi:hypothetical protein
MRDVSTALDMTKDGARAAPVVAAFVSNAGASRTNKYAVAAAGASTTTSPFRRPRTAPGQ